MFIYPIPLIPFPFKGEGDELEKGAVAPLGHPKYGFGECKRLRKESSLGELKRGLASLTQLVPPLLNKERGNKGVRLINKLDSRAK